MLQLDKMKKKISFRWILLAAGILAMIGLTGMNVYSLYALRNHAIDSEKENKKLQVTEFTDKVRRNFIDPFWGLGKVDMVNLANNFETTGTFPKEATEIFDKAARDSIFKALYFIPSSSDICKSETPDFLKYDSTSKTFKRSRGDKELICDGMGMARTRMRVLLEEYNFNNKVIFDTHRSMTIALVNVDDRTIIGYLTMPINQPHLTDNVLKPMLEKEFGPKQNSGMVVWLRDWTKDKIITKSDSSEEYDRDRVQFRQQFPDYFDDWYLAVAFTENKAVAATNASLIKNFIVLGLAFSLLLGALIFMFITAQREQMLAQRQASFLANVTHELKTPLAVMQAAGENLADGRVDDQNRLQAYGNHIYSEAVRLKKMIEKLLDVAKADANQPLMEPKPVSLSELLNKYVEEHRSYIENKGFELETDIEKNLPLTMLDTESFETIVGNLVENAIKYSDIEKYISISLKRDGDNNVLRIEDHGVGIPKKSIKHIFEKFYRAEDALTAETKGHGLGLSIVKNLVELNGGTIDVSSETGEGTVFTITFPILVDPDTDTISEKETYSSSQLTSDSPEYVG